MGKPALKAFVLAAGVALPLAARAALIPNPDPTAPRGEDQGDWWVRMASRLKPGVPDSAALAQLAALFRDQVVTPGKPLNRATAPDLVMKSGARGFGGMKSAETSALWTLMLLVPAYAAIRLAGERSDHNVDLLFISTLRPRSIIAGKFFAALVLAILVFSTCAPFMTFTYLLRGIDIPTILIVLGFDLLGMLLSTIIALFVAAVPGPRDCGIRLGQERPPGIPSG